MKVESAVQVWCDQYERLLKESQVALTKWNRGRAEIHDSGRRGRDVDSELRTLQANFARAWALLQYHEHDCEVCQTVVTLDGERSETERFHQRCQ